MSSTGTTLVPRNLTQNDLSPHPELGQCMNRRVDPLAPRLPISTPIHALSLPPYVVRTTILWYTTHDQLTVTFPPAARYVTHDADAANGTP